MKKASRFSRNVSSSVAPPTQHGAGSSAGAPRDYFAEDDEEDNRGGGASSLYNSTDNALAAAGADTIDDSDEVDPLDAFMLELTHNFCICYFLILSRPAPHFQLFSYSIMFRVFNAHSMLFSMMIFLTSIIQGWH